MHFSWFHYLVPSLHSIPDAVLTAAFCTMLIVVLSIIAYFSAGTPEQALIPAPGASIRSFFELVVEGFSGFVESVMGKGHENIIPIIGSLFIYILLNNFLGLFPGFTPATENFNTTLACGLFVFLLYNYFGVKENGISYFKHFLGPILWLAPLMLPIEIVSHLVRPMSLGLRLFGNMTGDHTVLAIFLNLIPIGVPIIFYVLGMFVCFVQAFVFSLLSMVYVSLATAHDH
ncbi:MAG: F0F1 ATP synthase subunit A [Oligoflexia bacterium]|nr:F0F1 ATP synthase subunit A [Oligoflexia bacterium]